ncbi:MAG TPA: chemotaxis protein CheW [Permianibacter sp.]|nr:chemotaxis protein CheW [Permianibacter sp.]
MSQRRAEQALSEYLDRLLQPEAAPPVSPRPLAEPVVDEPALLPAARSRLQQLLDQVSEVSRAPANAPVPSPAQTPASVAAPAAIAARAKVQPVSPPAPAAMAVEPIPQPLTAVAAAVADAQAGVYSNADYRRELPASFPTLVFRVDELRLALPLHLLGGIQRRDKPLTPLVGRAEWFLGLMPHEPDNINVVDTGRYLLGDKYRPELVDGYRYVIRIGDTAWGLACTDLCATRGLSQDDVRWYDSNPRRPWLAGMIKEDRCALLNARALVEVFEQHGRRAA